MSEQNAIERFEQRRLLRPAVLIVEPNPYHGELLPGFVDLFQNCGYEVHVLMRPEVARENPFVLFKKGKLPVIFEASREGMKTLMLSNLERYEMVFLSTNVNWEKDSINESYIRYLNRLPNGKYGSLFVEHNLLYLNQDDGEKLFEEGRVFTLLNYSIDGKRTKMLNPHYFGKGLYHKRKSPRKRILVIGSSSRDPKNLEQLFTALRSMDVAIKVSIVGGKVKVPQDLRNTVTLLGRLDFKDYYHAVMEHDYLLTLIDLDSTDVIHAKYAHGTTTGTVQISLGFTKPMIIDSRHAQVYGFDDRQAVIFDEGQLEAALINAVTTTDKDYAKMVSALQKKARIIKKISIKNLKNTISHFKRLHSIMPPKGEVNSYLSAGGDPIIGDQMTDIDRVKPADNNVLKRFFRW